MFELLLYMGRGLNRLGRLGYYDLRAENLFYFYFIIPVFFLSFVVQIKMLFTYNKYKKIRNKKGLSGAVVARNILDSYGLQYVRVEEIYGNLSDHFDPAANVVRLSQENYEGTSVAAVGIAAHEVGHAIQYKKEYFPIKIRSVVIPLVRFGSYPSIIFVLLGLFFSNTKIAYIGLFLFFAIVFFELATLFVEFDASRRAIKNIVSYNILDEDEVGGVKNILWAAAMTYVVSLLNAVVQLVRLILIVFSSRNRDD